MASLESKKVTVSKDLVETKEKSKVEMEITEETGQAAAIEHIVNHDFIRESREFWKKEMAKDMAGQRDVNTKVLLEKK
jgi:hypothetical protein